MNWVKLGRTLALSIIHSLEKNKSSQLCKTNKKTYATVLFKVPPTQV